jgi:hypothetical protein
MSKIDTDVIGTKYNKGSNGVDNISWWYQRGPQPPQRLLARSPWPSMTSMEEDLLKE